jgi:hypothetical protein
MIRLSIIFIPGHFAPKGAIQEWSEKYRLSDGRVWVICKKVGKKMIVAPDVLE